MLTISEHLAQFVHSVKFQTIPEEVAAKVKLHLLDSVGICLVSGKMEFARVVYKTASEFGKGTESTVIGFGKKLPAIAAAFVNGTLGHGIDFDDTHMGAVLHVSAAIDGAGLAVAEAYKVSGRNLIEGLAVGMETTIRLGLIAEGRFNVRGMHQTGMFTPFGACMATGKMLNLSQEALENGLGICGTMASGLTQIEKSWLKRMNPGWAAHSGIIAAYLARNGFIGPREVFEGVHGLFPSHLGNQIPFKWNLLTNGLGSRWEILHLAIKPYPACHYIHAFIDCARFLRETHGLSPEDIARIECKVPPQVVSMVVEPRAEKVKPLNPYMAQFSLQYLVAAMLVKGYVNLDTVYFEPLDDPKIVDLARKVEWSPDAEADYPVNFPGEVTIVLKDGREFSHRERFNRGSPRNPLSKDEVVNKFMDNACRTISKAKAKKIAELIGNLEKVTNVSELAKFYK